MENFAQARQMAIQRLNQLPAHRLVQVLDFIDFLLERPRTVDHPKPEAPQGSWDDLQACVGILDFEAGELDEILAHIEQARMMELEQSHDGLLA